MKKIISMSLWVQKDRMNPSTTQQCGLMYCNGAIRNMEIQMNEGIFKDWIFRIFIDDSVPLHVQSKLKSMGAELINMTNVYVPESYEKRYPGMYWRFLPMDDPSVDVFIVRDVDSRINKRDELAVNDWLKTDKVLHVMRDHPHHYYKILGGMWGHQSHLHRIPIQEKINEFLKNRKYTFKRMDDMKFLDYIYDYYYYKNYKDEISVVEHDQFFNYSNAISFPSNEYNPKLGNYYHFVGEIFDKDDEPVTKERDADLFKNYKKIMTNKKHLFK